MITVVKCTNIFIGVHTYSSTIKYEDRSQRRSAVCYTGSYEIPKQVYLHHPTAHHYIFVKSVLLLLLLIMERCKKKEQPVSGPRKKNNIHIGSWNAVICAIDSCTVFCGWHGIYCSNKQKKTLFHRCHKQGL